MTLPFSDKPEKSSIYQDVKTETLQELTPAQFDAFRARMFAEGVNGLEDEYRRLLLLGLASDKLSTAGPIPATIELIEDTFTSVGYKVYFTPPAGTVYQIMGVSVGSTTGLSGSGFIEVDLHEPVAGTRFIFIDQTFTSSSDFPATEIQASPLFCDENHSVRIRAEGTWTSVNNVVLAVLRVR